MICSAWTPADENCYHANTGQNNILRVPLWYCVMIWTFRSSHNCMLWPFQLWMGNTFKDRKQYSTWQDTVWSSSPLLSVLIMLRHPNTDTHDLGCPWAFCGDLNTIMSEQQWRMSVDMNFSSLETVVHLKVLFQSRNMRGNAFTMISCFFAQQMLVFKEFTHSGCAVLCSKSNLS